MTEDEITQARAVVDLLYREWDAAGNGGEALNFGDWLIMMFGVGEKVTDE